MLGFLFVLISLAGFASAASSPRLSSRASNQQQQLLNSAMPQINCKTNFTVTFINYLVSAVPSLSSLSSQAATLQQETTQLQAYASGGNTTNFISYIKNIYDPSLRQIRTTTQNSLKSANISRNTIIQLRNQYNTTLGAYQTCAFNAQKQFATAKGDSYGGFISYYQQTVQTLSAKGLNTTALTALVNNANSQIVLPYQNAVSAATTPNALNAALAQYCLFDGCKSGTSFHLAANFDNLKLAAMYNKIKSSKPKLTSNQTAQLLKVQADLNAASSELSAVGTSQYTQSSGQSVFTALNQTVTDMKGLRKH
jgi:hypothetical protein